MKGITAKEFINNWLKFSSTLTSQTDWKKNWISNTAWSKFVLGTKSSDSLISPIGKFYKNIYSGLRYRTEDGLFDLAMSLHNNFNQIASLNRNYETFHYDIDESVFYPVIFDVVLEHENQLYDSFREVAKLAWVRSFLKVLITYYSERTNEAQRQKENEMVQENFKNIIGGCCHEFPDNEQTEYVLLMGWVEGNELKWTSNVFDASGNLKNL